MAKKNIRDQQEREKDSFDKSDSLNDKIKGVDIDDWKTQKTKYLFLKIW